MSIWQKLFGRKSGTESPEPLDPRFRWIKDTIWGKRWDEIPFEDCISRLLLILRDDPKCKPALEWAAMFAHGNIKRLGFEVIRNPLLDPIFAQCDECGDCWIPDPTAKAVAMNIVLNPIGVGCDKCGRVLCRRCYEQLTVTCSRCRRDMESVIHANGRKRPARRYYGN
jgi:hypothetical protein